MRPEMRPEMEKAPAAGQGDGGRQSRSCGLEFGPSEESGTVKTSMTEPGRAVEVVPPSTRLIAIVMGVPESGDVRQIAYAEAVRLAVEYPEHAAELCRTAVSAAAARELEITEDLLVSFFPGRDLR